MRKAGKKAAIFLYFLLCIAIEFTISNSVTIIGNYAFLGANSLIIYSEAKSKANGLQSNWNSSSIPVIWGYTE